MCGHNPKGFEYMCATEVQTFEGLPNNMGRMRLQTQNYAVFLHVGSVSDIRKTWERIIEEWLSKYGYQSAHQPDFEVYGPDSDPLTGLGRVEIWIAVLRDTERVGFKA